MTVQATTNFVTYIGDDAQLVFNFTFRVDDIAWLSVDFTDDFDQFNLNVDQDLSPGGNATYLVAPPSPGMGGPDQFTITRSTPLSQELNYTRYDPFDSEANEDSLDKLTMQIQDVNDRLTELIGLGTLTGEILKYDAEQANPGYIPFGGGVSEFLLPAQDGTPGQVVVTDGLGQWSYVNLAPGVIAGSVDNSTIRYNLGANLFQEFSAYLFPVADGGASEFLQTDGAGQLTFVAIPASNVVDGAALGDVPRWDNISSYVVASGVHMEATATPPPSLVGYLRFNTTSTVDERQAQMMWDAANTTSTHYYAATSVLDGFYCRTRATAQTHAWGVSLSGVDSDLWHINEDGQFHFLAACDMYMVVRAAPGPDLGFEGQIFIDSADDGLYYKFNATAAVRLDITPSGLPGVNGCKAFGSAAQPINTSVVVSVALNSEAYDTDSIHDNVTFNSRLTVPTGVTRIRLTGYVKWEPNGSAMRQTYIRKNGAGGTIDDDQAGYEPTIYTSAAGASAEDQGINIDSGIIRAVATDYFELRVEQTSGLQLDLLAGDYWFQMEIIE